MHYTSRLSVMIWGKSKFVARAGFVRSKITQDDHVRRALIVDLLLILDPR